MQKVICLVLIAMLVSGICKSQEVPESVGKISSPIARMESRETEKDKWDYKDFIITHLVVFDKAKKKINTYRGSEKIDDLDYTAVKKETTKTGDNYIFECVDGHNLQCKGLLMFLNDKPFAFRIDYPLGRFWYFFAK